MNRWTTTALPLVFVLAACGPIVAPTGAGPTVQAATQTPASPIPTTAFDRPVVLQSASLSLITQDPVGASAALEALVLEAGGYVVSASSWSATEGGGYASLSARVPPEALASLRRSAIEAATQTQSDSLYSQDVSVEYGFLAERAADLERADAQLQRLLPEAHDPEAATSFMLLRELLLQERKNVETQLQNYQSRMTLASLDVSWTQVATTAMPLE